MRAPTGQGANAWLTMAQTWLELAQVAERRESAPAGDALPLTAVPGADASGSSGNSEPSGGGAR
jgi:hypothetical protein